MSNAATAEASGPLGRAGTALARLGLDSPRRLVLWTIVLGTALRIATGAIYGLGNGESYYLATARHLALSYFDQPPLSLWIAHATLTLTGSEAAVVLRLPFILMFAGTTWLMFRFGALLFGEAAGAFAALLLNLSPVFSGMAAVWMQPDGVLMFFMVAAMLVVARIAVGPPLRNRLVAWVAAGALLGLAMLAKYHAALLIAGILAFALTSRPHRRWFAQPGPYLAALVALAIFSPVLIWNAQNDWVSFGFQSGRIAESLGIHPEWLGRMILGQALYIGLWLWVPMLIVYWRAIRRGPPDPASWLLSTTAFLPVVVFTVSSLWAPLGWHFHWQAPGYLMLFPLLGGATVAWLQRAARRPARWLLWSSIAIVAIVIVFATQAATGWMRILLPGFLAPALENVADPTLEGLDWTELREAAAERGLLDAERVFAVTPMWHLAGKVDRQLGRDMPVVCLCDDPRNIAFAWDHTTLAGWDALIVNPDGFLADPVATYGAYFTSIEPLGAIEVTRGGVPTIPIELYIGRGFHGDYPLPLPPQ